jgi:hypothetical protein
MNNLLLEEVLDGIDSLNTWDCTLWFPDDRDDSGMVDLCEFIEYQCFSSEVGLEQHKYTDEHGYYFSSKWVSLAHIFYALQIIWIFLCVICVGGKTICITMAELTS